MRRPLLALLALGVAAVVHPAVAAPGDVGGVVVAGPGGATLGYTTRVTVSPQGTPLTFYNADQLAHTVTSVDRDVEGRPLFDSSTLPGSTVTVAGADRLRAGSYSFFCSFHPNMSGTLLVQGGSGGVGPVAPRFEQRLRIPRQVTGSRITLVAQQADVQVLPRQAPTTMLTYGGSWPGPTIRRPVGQLTTVTVVNHLPGSFGETSLHLHGDHHSSADDGQPATQLIRPGRSKTYTLPLRDGGKAERAALSF
jgi:plastocyanin